MHDDGGHRQLTSNGSRITAIVEINGREGRVLDEGTRLVRMIADELDTARLVSLRLEYDPAAANGRVVAAGTDMVDIVRPSAESPEEAMLWELALRAGRPVTA
jgi:hypothetical protein